MVGDVIRKYRTTRDMSLRGLAQATGLSFSFIADIERGRANPSLKSLLKLMDALDIPAEELQNMGKENPTRKSA